MRPFEESLTYSKVGIDRFGAKSMHSLSIAVVRNISSREISSFPA